MMKKLKFIIPVLLVLLVGAFFFFRQRSQKGQYREEVVVRRDITQTIELSGKVEAEKRADLKFSPGGLVTYYPFKEGDRVGRFQTIAALDQRQIQQNLKKQLNLYAIERGEFDQTQDDHEKEIQDGDIDKELRRILEKAQYQLDNSVIDVELQDLSAKLARIYAPFDGILVDSPITSPHVNVGLTDIFTLIDPSSLYFLADLDEGDLQQVRPGQQAVITLDAFPGTTISTSVKDISFSPKETTAGTTYQLNLPISSPFMAQLRLGLNGTAEIVLNEKVGVLTVSLLSVRENDQGNKVVLVSENGKPVERVIETGIEDIDYVEVVSGLQENDKILIEE